MKTFTIKEYRIQLLWPEIKHLHFDDRHDAYVLADTRLRIAWGNGYWLFGAQLLGFGIGVDYERPSVLNSKAPP